MTLENKVLSLQTQNIQQYTTNIQRIQLFIQQFIPQGENNSEWITREEMTSPDH